MDMQTDRQLLQETHDAVIELSAVVLGVKGQGGLVQDLQEVKLQVTEMTLKSSKGETDIKSLLENCEKEIPRIEHIETRLTVTEQRQAFNRIMIYALWSVVASVALALLYLILSHFGGSDDLMANLIYIFSRNI